MVSCSIRMRTPIVIATKKSVNMLARYRTPIRL